MAKHVLVIGAGTGGLFVANKVARQLSWEIGRGQVSVTILGDKDEYVYQPGFLYVPFDLMRMEELVRKVRDLLVPGIQFIHDQAVRIDPQKQRVETAGGKSLSYDYLVLATGSEINPADVPGLSEGAQWFYTAKGALRLREAMANFTGGRVVIAIGLPHKCPVAPLEFTYMFDDWARRRGIREKTEIIYTFPINRAHSIEVCSDWAIQEFAKRDIHLETFFNMESVDPVKREVTSLEGTTFQYDLLVAIPPHVGAAVHASSGLGDEGNWVRTDRNTLQAGQFSNVFALGDTTNLPISKAGSVAHFQSEVLAHNLVNLLSGATPVHRYYGKAFCFIERGLDAATYITFDYQHPPVLNPPTEAIHWFKQAYNRIHWLNLKGVM